MFAGGGTNSATSHYSAYTISKIASIKMIELLDFEIEDCKFSIIGPGWIESKIHNATLSAGRLAGDNFEKTLKMRREKLMNPVDVVIAACNWVIDQPKRVVGGRNFSAVHDDFTSIDLQNKLNEDFDFFKLRRKGNGIYER
jgi:NAD(P)-dependent dehydrogenase (short-subunit alcohol dehydrogenase family)